MIQLMMLIFIVVMIIFIGDKINDELKINFLLANLCFIPLFLIHFSLQFDAFPWHGHIFINHFFIN